MSGSNFWDERNFALRCVIVLCKIKYMKAIMAAELFPEVQLRGEAPEKKRTFQNTHTPTHRRNRAKQPGDTAPTSLTHADSIAIQDSSCQMDIVNRKTNVVLRADISSVEGNIFRVKISEKSPIRPQYELHLEAKREPRQVCLAVQPFLFT